MLIVDGSAAVRTRLGERFADEGFGVLHAETALAALEIVSRVSVTTIVLDLHAARTSEPAIEGLVRLRSLAPEAMIVAERTREGCRRASSKPTAPPSDTPA